MKEEQQKVEFQETSKQMPLSLEEFLNQFQDDIRIHCEKVDEQLLKHTYYKIVVDSRDLHGYYILRRYMEFQAFYEAVKLKFENLSLPEFPESFMVFRKYEKRRKAFEKILRVIVQTVVEYESISRPLDKQQQQQQQSDLSLLNKIFFEKEMNFGEVFKNEQNKKKINQKKKKIHLDANIPELLGNDMYRDVEKRNIDRIENPFLEKEQINYTTVYTEEGGAAEKGKEELEEDPTKIHQIIDYQDNNNVVVHRSSVEIEAEQLLKDADNKVIKNEELILEVNQGTQDILEQKQISEGILLFQGNLYIKFSSELRWQQYFCRIINYSLMCYRSILDSDYIIQYNLYQCQYKLLQIIDMEYYYYIEISHEFDNNKLLVRIPITSGEDSNSISGKVYNMVQTIKNAANIQQINLQKILFKPIGKIILHIQYIYNFRNITNSNNSGSVFYIKIKHSPFIYNTKKVVVQQNQIEIGFHQKIVIPLNDHFFKIKLQVIRVQGQPWITDYVKEECILKQYILVTDIIKKCMKRQNIFNLRLSLENTKKNQGEVYMQIKINNITSMVQSYFARSLKEDYSEGKKVRLEDLRPYDLRVQISRIRRVIANVELFMDGVQDIIHYRYPLYSWSWLILIQFWIIVLDFGGLLNFILSVLIMITVINQPFIKYNLVKWVRYIYINQQQINKWYKVPIVYTIEQEQAIELSDLNRFRYYIRDDESYIETLQRLKKLIIDTQIYLQGITGFCEKLKNLMIWYDSYRAIIFVVMLFVFLGLINMINNVRVILFCVVSFVFYDGYPWYIEIVQHNRVQATKVLSYLYSKFNLDTTQPEGVKKFEIWPSDMKMEEFKKKLIQQTEQRLNIRLNEGLLGTMDTPEYYLRLIETCSSKIVFQFTKEENIAFMQEFYMKKRSLFNFEDIFNLIMNIPSDYYLITTPSTLYD